TAFNVSFFANETLIGNVRISSLNITESKIASIQWTPTIAGSYVIRAVADSGREIAEIDELNNERSISVTVVRPEPWQAYDRDGDGKIGDMELVNAIMDWLNNRLSDPDLINVIMKWLSG
ncbi:MAG: hypothetical protein NZ894_05665, partial [Archaeoglobaceae archaeon]|nr:hypothetical protein [Archaeoglobaceae archaeon]